MAAKLIIATEFGKFEMPGYEAPNELVRTNPVAENEERIISTGNKLIKYLAKSQYKASIPIVQAIVAEAQASYDNRMMK